MYRKYLEGEASSMTPERIKILNEIGFSWSGTFQPNASILTTSGNVQSSLNIIQNHQHYDRCNNVINNPLMSTLDQSWMIQYQKLKEYYVQNDKSYSKLKSSQHSKLTSWMVRQRREYQKLRFGDKSTLTKERLELLQAIDFDWSPRDSTWKVR